MRIRNLPERRLGSILFSDFKKNGLMYRGLLHAFRDLYQKLKHGKHFGESKCHLTQILICHKCFWGYVQTCQTTRVYYVTMRLARWNTVHGKEVETDRKQGRPFRTYAVLSKMLNDKKELGGGLWLYLETDEDKGQKRLGMKKTQLQSSSCYIPAWLETIVSVDWNYLGLRQGLA